jgi:hypothetical protein
MKLNVKNLFKNKWVIIIIIFCILLVFFLHILHYNSKVKEGFLPKPTPVIYSDATVTSYNAYIKDKSTTIPVKSLQDMGVPENDVNSFIQNGIWPWSDGFTKAIKQTILNSTNQDLTQVDNTQKIIPEQWFTNLTASATSRQLQSIANKNNLKCNIDSNGVLTGNGMYVLDASGAITDTVVLPSALPTKIPGFTFIDDMSCNPCNIGVGIYDCPFALPDNENLPLLPSFIMDYIWGIGNYDNLSSKTNISSNMSSSFSNLFS